MIDPLARLMPLNDIASMIFEKYSAMTINQEEKVRNVTCIIFPNQHTEKVNIILKTSSGFQGYIRH